ncbi:MAG TPA: FHIPEP family type III secretion protein, partial [Azospirillaceae bacterium]|nr:FHIPEP family type III secretion protein [Azospirillaceae bacterium]
MALMEQGGGGPGGGGGGGSSNMAAFGEMYALAKKSILRGDIAMAFGIVLIIVCLIMPMPALLLDMMLGVNITVSVLILMVVLFIDKPLQLSSYPTILLITTLLRLALNMASTRLILTQGHEGTDAAGHVIQAFAGFVMGGDFIIGIIIYAILTIVNFKVITAGSGRIAEVAARFTLDAMPGKQMAIDADLSAGMIDETTARERRKELEDESAFFGSMDGASKFVKGDAVAGLIIMFINIIGGVTLATLRHGMPFMEALDTFTKLTIGDGLVSQIPALVISISAGFLVSKAGMGGSTDKAVVGQLTNHSAALALSAGAIVVLALLPGMPLLTFAPVAAVVGYAAWYFPRKRA